MLIGSVGQKIQTELASVVYCTIASSCKFVSKWMLNSWTYRTCPRLYIALINSRVGNSFLARCHPSALSSFDPSPFNQYLTVIRNHCAVAYAAILNKPLFAITVKGMERFTIKRLQHWVVKKYFRCGARLDEGCSPSAQFMVADVPIKPYEKQRHDKYEYAARKKKVVLSSAHFAILAVDEPAFPERPKQLV